MGGVQEWYRQGERRVCYHLQGLPPLLQAAPTILNGGLFHSLPHTTRLPHTTTHPSSQGLPSLLQGVLTLIQDVQTLLRVRTPGL